MKDKLLFIMPSIPEMGKGLREQRTWFIWQALAERFEIHVLYSHDMSTTTGALEALRSRGITAISVRDLKKYGVYAFENQLARFIAEYAYRCVCFQSIYSAKYYIPFFVLSGIDVRILIDAGRSTYADELHRADAQSTTLLTRTVARKTARMQRLKEIAIYRHADVICVSDQAHRDVLSNDMPDKDVRVIVDPRSDDDAARVGEQALAACAAVLDLPPARSRPDIRATPLLATGDNRLAAYNATLRQMQGPYGVVAMPDTQIDQFAIERMVFCAESDPTIGCVSPVSNLLLTTRISGRQTVADFIPRHFMTNIGHWHESKRLAEPCFLLRKTALDQIGYLDERFNTLYFGLYDFGLRLYQAGYIHVVDYEAFVFHADPVAVDERVLLKDKQVFMEKWAQAGTSLLDALA